MDADQSSVYLVTGAASGIGAATARRIVRSGNSVVIADLDASGATRLAESLSADGAADVVPVGLDVADEEQWVTAINVVEQRFGRLNGLVNNAGVTADASLRKMQLSQWDRVVDVHLKGAWLGCRAAATLLAASSAAAIVNISSGGRHGSFGQANYSAAKAGVVGLTKTVAVELAPKGVRCNAVAPGAVATPMLATVPDHVIDQWERQTLLGRIGQPDEIADAVWFLLSPAAGYITGQVLDVNGGELHY